MLVVHRFRTQTILTDFGNTVTELSANPQYNSICELSIGLILTCITLTPVKLVIVCTAIDLGIAVSRLQRGKLVPRPCRLLVRN